MQLQPNTTYTINDLKEIAGDNYMSLISAAPIIELPSPNKPVIYSFSDFDSDTQAIYSNLYRLLSSLNYPESFLLFAVGDRVIGNWRTEEEVQLISSQYNTIILNNNYEFFSNAKILPSSVELLPISSQIPIIFNSSNNTHRVIIPPPNE